MYARVATFETDPSNVDSAIEYVRGVTAGDVPPGLEGARTLMCVNRATGQGLGITLFASEEAMRRGDEVLNSMSAGSGSQRASVEFYEVPVHTIDDV